MSNVVTRASAVGEDRKQSESPVKDMKKKVAANAEKEKEKNAAEKNSTSDKQTDKNVEKVLEKTNEKQAEKHNEKQAEKQHDKKTEKQDKPEKKTEKQNDKQPEKKAEKQSDKNVEKKTDKPPVESTDAKEKGDKHAKDAKPEKRQTRKPSATIPPAPARNDTQTQNGGKEPLNGTSSVTPEEDDEDIRELEKDELFPELVYEDGSDNEGFELTEGGHNRSTTRRSQVKNTRTPETPKPASEKQTDKDTKVNADEKSQENINSDPRDTKVLKLKDDLVPASDRRLRSADRHTPDIKESETKPQDNGPEVIITVELDDDAQASAEGGRRKLDTNYAKSRVKVSPYRRSGRVADQTTTSTAANYTGNNTTMEMDITETSFSERPSTSEDASLMEDSYVSSLKNIKGRKSYKQLKELSLKELALNRSKREAAKANLTAPESRPTGHVVGRKRRPAEDEHQSEEIDVITEAPGTKRIRLVDRVLSPFVRRTVASSTPLPARRAAPIVGINTDLPLSAPIATSEPFDPETLKQPSEVTPEPVANKRCSIQ